MRILGTYAYRVVCLLLTAFSCNIFANEIAIELVPTQCDGAAYSQATPAALDVQRGDSLEIIFPPPLKKSRGYWVLAMEYFCIGQVKKLTVAPDTKPQSPSEVSHHPYPQSLFNPRTWEDTQATFDFNTKKITPQNLEVLDAYMKLPSLRFQGQVRSVHLSENGFNSKDYSAEKLEDQAAGMALAVRSRFGDSTRRSALQRKRRLRPHICGRSGFSLGTKSNTPARWSRE